jgi:hypothetical protein
MHRMAVGAACAAILLTATSARSEEHPSGLVFDEYQPVELRPLSELGDDAIRFSSRPALGSSGYVVEVVRLDPRTVNGRILYVYGHPSEGWFQTVEMLLEMHPLEYEELARWVDEEMAKADPQPRPDGTIMLCADGPGYLTERRKAGADSQLEGSCGVDHPNSRISLAMGGLIKRTLTRWEPRN